MSKSGNINTTISGGSPLDLNVGLTGSVAKPITLDAGLSDIGIAVTGDSGHPLTLDLALSATGDKLKPVAVDLGLNVHVDQLDLKLEPVELKLDPLELKLDPLELRLDPVKVDLGLDNINVCLSLAFTEFPRMQMHMPKKYDFGLTLLGVQVFNFSICGESSVITQDNPPRIYQKFTAGRPNGAHADPGWEGPFRVDLS